MLFIQQQIKQYFLPVQKNIFKTYIIARQDEVINQVENSKLKINF